jgi:hypothetical protein
LLHAFLDGTRNAIELVTVANPSRLAPAPGYVVTDDGSRPRLFNIVKLPYIEPSGGTVRLQASSSTPATPMWKSVTPQVAEKGAKQPPVVDGGKRRRLTRDFFVNCYSLVAIHLR